MATLHLMVGLPCSGKTTKARKLEKEYNALLLSPDIWYQKLFGNNLKAADHDKNRDVIESIMWGYASRVLKLGVDVILDSGFCTKAEREKIRNLAINLGVNYKIHYLDVPVNELYRRIEKRNKKSADGTFIFSKEEMDKQVSVFQPPDMEELK